jgi:hypothetical protein
MTGASIGLTSPHNMDYQHTDLGFSGARLGTAGLQGDQIAMGSPFGQPFTRIHGKRIHLLCSVLYVVYYRLKPRLIMRVYV